MIDQDTLLNKASRGEVHLRRITQKREISEQKFLQDTDRQDILLFNIQMAIQNCIDIAAHIVSDQGLGVPGSTNDIFLGARNDENSKSFPKKPLNFGGSNL